MVLFLEGFGITLATIFTFLRCLRVGIRYTALVSVSFT